MTHANVAFLAATTMFIAAVSTAQQTSTSTSTALNPEVLALKATSDLVIKNLGFNALGEVAFELYNRGDVGINIDSGRTSAASVT